MVPSTLKLRISYIYLILFSYYIKICLIGICFKKFKKNLKIIIVIKNKILLNNISFWMLWKIQLRIVNSCYKYPCIMSSIFRSCKCRYKLHIEIACTHNALSWYSFSTDIWFLILKSIYSSNSILKINIRQCIHDIQCMFIKI